MAVAPIDVRTSLKATCPRKDLFEAVQIVGHAVTGRSPLDIRKHILIQSEGDSLRLIATDDEIAISCRIGADVTEAGGLCAPAKTLTEVLANLPDMAEVDLSVDVSHAVRLHSESSDYKILGLPVEDYDALPEVVDVASFPIQQSRLKTMIRQTIFAVSPEETRAILTGILIEFQEDELKLVATDTHRLAVKSAVVHGGHGSQNAIVPSRAMAELAKLLTDTEGEVLVTLSNNQVRFDLPGDSGVQITSKLIEGQFPNYHRVVPSSHEIKLSAPVAPLSGALRRAYIVAKEAAGRVVLRARGEKLELTAEALTVGQAYEEIEIARHGEEIQIAFNAKYLLDVLSAIDDYGVHIELTERLKPGVVRPVPDPSEDGEALTTTPDYLCVLMPMQIV
ncbi:MAG TPA: DNA polymerase III subunit beta [Chthonomonadales bacterium]|nr:DNA polymerase III subunit beta [Chthonomonadales bacterium]